MEEQYKTYEGGEDQYKKDKALLDKAAQNLRLREKFLSQIGQSPSTEARDSWDYYNEALKVNAAPTAEAALRLISWLETKQ